MKYAYIVIAALVVTVIILVVLSLFDKKKRGGNSQQYLEMLSQLYTEKSVIDSLLEVRESFKKGSVEYIALDKAVFYLTQSIMRDYETAFTIIEKVFTDIEVKQLHQTIIEQEKANIVFMLQ